MLKEGESCLMTQMMKMNYNQLKIKTSFNKNSRITKMKINNKNPHINLNKMLDQTWFVRCSTRRTQKPTMSMFLKHQAPLKQVILHKKGNKMPS